jgi:RNA polymerase sigma factor (sigma-70 family)
MDTVARNRLVEESLEGVRAIAARLARRLPPSFDLEDLVQQGCLGLIAAANSYDGRPGVTFFAFARRRAKGSMLDYIRRRHWRNATVGGLELVEHAPAPDRTEDRVQHLQEVAEVNRALRRLPDRELAIIRGFYGQGQTNQDIGPGLGIKGSRVGQIHRQALERLSRNLAALRRVA